MLGVTWHLFQRVPLTPACCKLQHKHIPENAPDFGIHLLWQHRGVGSAARKVVCFLTPCINTSGCHCPGAAAGPVLASKGAADLPELACVSSQCGRLGTAAGLVLSVSSCVLILPSKLNLLFTCQTLQICFGSSRFPSLSQCLPLEVEGRVPA